MYSLEIPEENKLLRNLVDSSYDGLFITDNNGEILYCNDSYLRISGLRREAVTANNIVKLVEVGVIPDACTTEVLKTHKSHTKIIDYPKGQSALVTSTPIFDESGQFIYVLSNVRDITELVKIKERLRNTENLNQEYRRKLNQAERASRHDARMLVYSPEMKNLVALAQRVANVSSPVLIQGESGVGKDMMARFIHDCQEDSEERPFVLINCSAIPETLLESELFGYEAGAFTGASRKGKVGLFELANNGTLFLDEIGDMPLTLQVKLLDVLQTQKLFRVGGTKLIEINTRIISATNTKLEQLINEGKFRRDLYYRLNVIPVYIPPLRERQEDLVHLIFHFVETKNRKFNLTKKLSPKATELLTAYSWPGNIRELRNVVENLVITADSDTIEERHIPAHISTVVTKPLFIDTPDYFESYNLKEIMDVVECEVIRKALAEFGSLRKAAAHMGIDLSTLVRKKRRYGL